MGGEGARILVVDDQEEIRDLTAAILTGEGYEVSTACNGEEALSAAYRQRFDLILLDINMPGMDGWETLRLTRADDDLATVPVVLFSIRGEVRNKIQGMQLGARGYITKPFTMDELIAGVRRHLEGGPGVTGALTDDARSG